ncbi:type II toxin-antitoxin system PemK/MazF family toxin [Clostridium perfringens]|uniref:type II toxin-antitoxin system PemK/MazF family toxin n=1 Tax=Clostridium perfringens TaxID=1502 RepID=UPI000E135C88|nr:type II toxin-antitoxin system PemK/MazF family toxin [Clostridium perfringens]SUY29656.1 PemK-like protein [Clostridium perfringens]HAT4138779.1 hypothetical protein [Clostridium perfringens]
MKTIINGGLYNVNFYGKESCEFKGEHPTLIVRTLKENDIYIAIPLTSYTKERWQKCKSKGFGIRILSSNSIARIDKFKVINKSSILNRWKSNNKTLKITPEELKNLNAKLDNYINLSSVKAQKEYNYYITQYDLLYSELLKTFKNKTSSIINKEVQNNNVIITINKSNTSWICMNDLKELIADIYNYNNPIITIYGNKITIELINFS